MPIKPPETVPDPARTAAEIVKLTAEAEHFRAQAKLAEAGTDKAKAEARQARASAEIVERDLAERIRTDRATLSQDAYNQRYTFTEQVNPTTVAKCMTKLTEWSRSKPDCEIEIVFTSPGGSIVDGMALFDFIMELRRQGHVVTTHTLGMAASMAGILLQAGDRRTMGKEAWLLIHEASFGTGGKIGEVEDTVEWVKKVGERILDIFISRSHVTRAFMKKNWARRDWWLSSDDALKYGFIDEIR